MKLLMYNAFGVEVTGSQDRRLTPAARQAAGADFDVRTFHNTVLGRGPLPLHVLEGQVQSWIRQEQAGR